MVLRLICLGVRKINLPSNQTNLCENQTPQAVNIAWLYGTTRAFERLESQGLSLLECGIDLCPVHALLILPGMHWLYTLDVSLFRFINLRLSNPLFDRVMPFFSGNPVFFPLLIGAALLLIWK